MGRDDDVVASYQLVRSQIRSLVVQHVRAERTELARIERVHKRFLINAQAAAQVDEDRTSRHQVERRLVEKRTLSSVKHMWFTMISA